MAYFESIWILLRIYWKDIQLNFTYFFLPVFKMWLLESLKWHLYVAYIVLQLDSAALKGLEWEASSLRDRETGEHAQYSFTGTIYTVQDDEDPHRTSLQVRIGHMGLDSESKFNLDLASGFGKRRAGLWWFRMGIKNEITWGFSGASVVKSLPANAGDTSSVPGSGQMPWGRKWQPLHFRRFSGCTNGSSQSIS